MSSSKIERGKNYKPTLHQLRLVLVKILTSDKIKELRDRSEAGRKSGLACGKTEWNCVRAPGGGQKHPASYWLSIARHSEVSPLQGGKSLQRT